MVMIIIISLPSVDTVNQWLLPFSPFSHTKPDSLVWVGIVEVQNGSRQNRIDLQCVLEQCSKKQHDKTGGALESSAIWIYSKKSRESLNHCHQKNVYEPKATRLFAMCLSFWKERTHGLNLLKFLKHPLLTLMGQGKSQLLATLHQGDHPLSERMDMIWEVQGALAANKSRNGEISQNERAKRLNTWLSYFY